MVKEIIRGANSEAFLLKFDREKANKKYPCFCLFMEKCLLFEKHIVDFDSCQLLEMVFEERLTLIVLRSQMSCLKQHVFGYWALCPSKNQSQQFSGCPLTNRQLSIERIAWDFEKDSVFIK